MVIRQELLNIIALAGPLETSPDLKIKRVLPMRFRARIGYKIELSEIGQLSATVRLWLLGSCYSTSQDATIIRVVVVAKIGFRFSSNG